MIKLNTGEWIVVAAISLYVQSKTEPYVVVAGRRVDLEFTEDIEIVEKALNTQHRLTF